MAAKNGIIWPRAETFTLTLSSQNHLCNSNSWPKVQKSGITWPGILFVLYDLVDKVYGLPTS
jgi:hypothetical protein